MPNNWKTYKLGEVATLQRGFDLPNTKRIPGKYPVIAASGFSSWHNNHKVEGPGVTTGRSGTLGKVFYEENNFWPLNTSLWVKDFHNNHPKYIYYFLNTLNFQNYNSGTSVPTLNRNDVHSLEVEIPNLKEQTQIANILSAIDNKIENNLAINKTLEEMAMALYKHWFIDFDFPVSKKSHPELVSGPQTIGYKTAGGDFIDSELGQIPKGWEVREVKEIFNITIGRTPPRKEPQWFSKKNGVKWISIKDLGSSGSYIFKTSEFLTEEAVKKFRVPIIANDTVVLSFKLTVGRVAISTETMLSNEAIAHFNEKEKGYLGTEYIYLYLKNFDFNSLGSTSSIATAVNSQTIKNINFLIPKEEPKREFKKQVQPYFNQIKNNQIENQSLTKLRDTLLPKLISGEIRLKEFQEKVETILQ